MSDLAIETEQLSREFRTSSGEIVPALQGVSIAVKQGEVVALLGPNGAGKTTLTRVLSTLLLPTGGTARILGFDVDRDAEKVRAITGVIFGGEKGLYNRVSADENMKFFGTLAGLSRRELRVRVPEVLEQVNLGDVSHRRVETFSKGMRQRLHVAIGLLARPPVLLLDEPTVGLDPVEAARLRALIAGLRDDGASILLTSHQLRDVEELADRIVLLDSGEVASEHTVAAFARLAGYAAIVSVTFRGDLDLSALSAEAEVEVADPPDESSRSRGEREATIRLRSWTGEVFGDLGRLLGRTEVLSVSVRQPTLDEAFVAAADRRLSR